MSRCALSNRAPYSLPTSGAWVRSGKSNLRTGTGWRTVLRNILAPLVLQSGPPATGLRKSEFPKSAGESAGKSAAKKGTAGGTAGSSAVSLFFQRKRPPGTAPSSPPSSPLFPGTLPSTLPALLGNSGFLSPVAGGPDCNSGPYDFLEKPGKIIRTGAFVLHQIFWGDLVLVY